MFGFSPLMMNSGTPDVEFIEASPSPVSSGGGGVTLSKLSLAQEDDLLLAFIVTRENVSTPSGWVKHNSGGFGTGLWMFSKVATSSEPSSYSWTASGSTSGGLLLAYRNASTVDVFSYAGFGTNTTRDLASVTATDKGALIAAFASLSGDSITTPPSGMVLRKALTGFSPATYDLMPSPPGATGVKSATFSTSGSHSGVLVQIV